jgi:hypothetical protein
MPWPDLPLPTAPIVALEPFRIANRVRAVRRYDAGEVRD